MLTSSGVRARIAWSKLSERRTQRRLRPDNPDLRVEVVAVHGGEFWPATVRDVSSSPALAGWLRVNAGTPAETTAFLTALKEVLHG